MIPPRDRNSIQRIGSERWATHGHRGRPVINPNTGGVQVGRIRARRWRKRLNQTAVVATVDGTVAVASVVPTASAAPTRFSNPVTAG